MGFFISCRISDLDNRFGGNMENYTAILLFLVGFVLIIKGSDWFIDSTIWVAKVLKVPNIIIGATLVSICTTLPEAMVSGSSAIRGNTDIAFGNAVGSIACNTGFILALTIMLSKPLITDKKKLKETGIFLLALIASLAGIGFFFGVISRTTGFIFLGIMVLYLYQNVKDAKASAVEIAYDESIDRSRKVVIKRIVLFVIGLIMTVIGANLLVTHGETLARLLGVPDVVIGLTLTAFGTSLPELVTAITAVVKKAHDISIGNVLGANILNIIMVLGLSSTITPIVTPTSYFTLHIPFVFMIVSMVVFFSFINRKHLHRWNGALIMGVYISYLYIMFR